MLVLGIDENGLGPLLGPLVVTAVAFEAPQYDRGHFWKIAGDFFPADDSKKMFSRAKMARAEMATLGWLSAFHATPSTYPELVASVVELTPGPRICGNKCPDYCRPSTAPLPCWSHSEASDVPAARIDVLQAGGLKPHKVRAVTVCPGEFNSLTGPGKINKFQLDFNMMMCLVNSLRADYEGPVLALCGKIGSTRRYGNWLDGAKMGLCLPLEEERAVSTYRVDEQLEVAFIRDADGLHLPVAVASMVGKYLRELAMRDLNLLLGEKGGRWASGYRDRVTREFVSASKKRREELGVFEGCFIRSS